MIGLLAVAGLITLVMIIPMGLHLFTYHLWVSGLYKYDRLMIEWRNEPHPDGYSQQDFEREIAQRMARPGPSCIVSDNTARMVLIHLGVGCLCLLGLIISKGHPEGPQMVKGLAAAVLGMTWAHLAVEVGKRTWRTSTTVHVLLAIALYVAGWMTGPTIAAYMLINS